MSQTTDLVFRVSGVQEATAILNDPRYDNTPFDDILVFRKIQGEEVPVNWTDAEVKELRAYWSSRNTRIHKSRGGEVVLATSFSIRTVLTYIGTAVGAFWLGRWFGLRYRA